MAENHVPNNSKDKTAGALQDTTLGRRGVLARAAAVAGAALAWFAGAGRAEANHSPGTGGPLNSDGQALHVDLVNGATQRTFLVGTVVGNPPMVVFNGTGPFSIGQADAIQGITRSNVGFAAGVQGRNQAATGSSIGVLGTTASTGGTGVLGTSGLIAGSAPAGSFGVYGISGTPGGNGVRGQINGGDESCIAVYGQNLSPADGPGVGAGGFGVYGYSGKGHGLVGATGTANAGAVVGATNGIPGAYAGVFYGPMIVFGAKSAAVAHPDGGHRLLYCLESPESWFEDFGSGTLRSGVARVEIDPEFARVTDMDAYHVFLTPYAEAPGLYVTERTPECFTVGVVGGATRDIEFSWRIVGKRKDIEAPRLARVDLPKEPRHPQHTPSAGGARAPEIPAPKRHMHKHPPETPSRGR
jgi:hypothetical protein